MKQKHIYAVLVFMFSFFLWPQDYNDLIKKKNNLIKESNSLNTSLLETQSIQKNSLEELKIINSKIDLQERLLEVLEEEASILKSQEEHTENTLDTLLIELAVSKENYTKLIQTADKYRRSYNRLLFFLSAANFNQLIRRLYHFKKIETNRRKKYLEINLLRESILLQKKTIIQKKAEQADLTLLKNNKIEGLKKTKLSQEKIIGSLKNKEDSLAQAIKIKDAETKKITEEILRLLDQKNNQKENLTPELTLISKNFSSNRGRLPWPVSAGFVISKFGTVPHPILPGITIINNGVEISSETNNVRSVFDGEVSKVIVLPTGFKVIIIRHGEYFSVYSNLNFVNVRAGQKVKTKEKVGQLQAVEGKKNNILGFQIWRAREKLNPLHWISR